MVEPSKLAIVLHRRVHQRNPWTCRSLQGSVTQLATDARQRNLEGALVGAAPLYTPTELLANHFKTIKAVPEHTATAAAAHAIAWPGWPPGPQAAFTFKLSGAQLARAPVSNSAAPAAARALHAGLCCFQAAF